MGFSFVTEIPSPDVIRERFPLAPELAARKKERDEEIKKIITGESDKLLVIVGPCSADNEEAVVDYVSRLVKVQEKTKDRLVASGCDVPVGLKNPTSGDLTVMLNSVVAAQVPHDFIFRGWEVQCPGNPLSHTILRGAVNKHGQTIPNYHYEDLRLLYELYMKRNLKNPACIVDTNHSNSGKQYMEQIRIAKEVLHSRRHSDDIKNLVKGLMIESYIEPGSQKIGEHCYGKSITDPCLGWDDTERLLYDIAELS